MIDNTVMHACTENNSKRLALYQEEFQRMEQ